MLVFDKEILDSDKLLTVKSKLGEKQGRKAIGPVKWQPATKIKFFIFI